MSHSVGGLYSLFNAFAGLVMAARIAWKLMIIMVMTIAMPAETRDTPGPIQIRKRHQELELQCGDLRNIFSQYVRHFQRSDAKIECVPGRLFHYHKSAIFAGT